MRRQFEAGQKLLVVVSGPWGAELIAGDRVTYVGIDFDHPGCLKGIKVKDSNGVLWFVDDDQVQPIKEEDK